MTVQYQVISAYLIHSLVDVSPGQVMSEDLRPVSEFGQVPDALAIGKAHLVTHKAIAVKIRI
jgi:hypothetical protein